MASYLELKQIIGEILSLDTEIDEMCDITVPLILYSGDDDSRIVIKNSDLQVAFDNKEKYTGNNLELSSPHYRENAVQLLGPVTRGAISPEPIIDTSNGLTYSIGPASSEYCLFILNVMADRFKADGCRSIGDLKGRIRIALRHGIRRDVDNGKPLEVLSDLLRITTIKISSEKPLSTSSLRDLAASFEFHVIYKSGMAISEYSDVQQMYSLGSSFWHYSRKQISSPPHRKYNREVLDFYIMAMETRDPFTMYISFYHVIEYYYDAVFKKKLTESIREKITHPDFSANSRRMLHCSR